MNKKLSNLGTYILNKCKFVTNHDVTNHELVVTSKAQNIIKGKSFLKFNELREKFFKRN